LPQLSNIFEMKRYQAAVTNLRQNPRTWLITGVAGFIGSHLLECLLSLGQAVVGLDNFSTGHPKNLDEALERGSVDARFRFIYGDTRQPSVCAEACTGVDIVLHHAALASVPQSITDPAEYHAANVDGFTNMLVAARDAKVKRFVYASSSAVYGSDDGMPQREERIGEPLSPYAATKFVNEIYARLFSQTYDLQTVGLRYFNVFGRRQDPQAAYAAVIPRWVSNFAAELPGIIMGDGKTTRDFVHVDDAVQANILAATVADDSATGQVYNVGRGQATSLNELYEIIRERMGLRQKRKAPDPIYEPFRPDDIRRSVADVTRIRHNLGFSPTRSVAEGIEEAIGWYLTMGTPPRGNPAINWDASLPPELRLSPPDGA
jgi:UDP-N-acetylglucosamine 4-epimerase